MLTMQVIAVDVVHVVAVDDRGVTTSRTMGVRVGFGRRVDGHRLSSATWVRASVMMCSMWESSMR